MARALLILKAAWRAFRRDGGSFLSFTGNNIFIIGVVLHVLGAQRVLISISGFIALMLFLPLSEDPLRHLPRERLRLWPIDVWELYVVRVLSLALSPALWTAGIILASRRVTYGVVLATAAMFAAGFALSIVPTQRLPHLRFPRFGRLSHLLAKNLRDITATLDFYAALLLSLGAFGFRLAGQVPNDALLPLTLLVVLCLSTHAQSLFALDTAAELTRYRLLPIAFWQLLAAKDAAFAVTALVLCLPLDPIAALGATAVALAAGHHASTLTRNEGRRWRFCSGPSFGLGLFQSLAIIVAGAGTVHWTPAVLVLWLGAWAASLWWYGLRRIPTSGFPETL